MAELIESFKHDLAEVCWRELRIHLQRDAIIFVSAGLDLVAVAVAVAEDDKGCVAQWISTGEVGKPDKDQLASWESDLDRPFRMLIVQPFILIQEVNHA